VNVLVVEDDLTQATYVSSSLRNHGIHVVTAATASAARAALESQHFDLIWLDVILPDSSGFSLCRQLKKNATTRDIPIVICSSKDGEIDREWGTLQGAAVYLTKPVESETIVSTVRRFMR
jgi:two-component system, chemotaxis family, response regulator PixH